MIAYVTVGADDIARAKLFYSAFLPALDYPVSYTHLTLPTTPYV